MCYPVVTLETRGTHNDNVYGRGRNAVDQGTQSKNAVDRFMARAMGYCCGYMFAVAFLTLAWMA